MGESDRFEVWLEQELRPLVESEVGSRPRARQALYRSAASRGRPGLLTRITGRGIGVVTASALALGGGGAALAAATGTVDPVSWGQAVVKVVQRCQDGSAADRWGARCGVPAVGSARPARPGSRRPDGSSSARGGGGAPVQATPPDQDRGVPVAAEPSGSPATRSTPLPGPSGGPGHGHPTPGRPGHPSPHPSAAPGAGQGPPDPHKPNQQQPVAPPSTTPG